MAAAVSSSVFATRLAELESPTTAKLNATFAGISDATRGSSPAHSQRKTFDVYATYARSTADLSTVVLHASTVCAGDAKAEKETAAKRSELYLSERMASTSVFKFLNVAGRHRNGHSRAKYVDVDAERSASFVTLNIPSGAAKRPVFHKDALALLEGLL